MEFHDLGLRYKTQFEDIQPTLEVNDGQKLTQSAGYRTAQQQIEEMLLAGQRLDSFRRGDLSYDYDEGYYDVDHEEDMPLTRMKGFEMAHASQLDLALREKFFRFESESENENEPINQLDVNRLGDTELSSEVKDDV